MDLGTPLCRYGPVDVSDLTLKLTALPPEFWEIDRSSRAKLARHRPGNAIFYLNDAPSCLTRPSTVEVESGILNVLRYPDRPLFTEIATLITGFVTPHFPDCDPVRVQLAELPPGQVISPHRDRGLLAMVHRLHIPLVTNPDVRFIVDGQTFYLEPGRLYDLNNVVTHSVENGSEMMRVHLMVDMLPSAVARVCYHDSESAMVAAAGPNGPT